MRIRQRRGLAPLAAALAMAALLLPAWSVPAVRAAGAADAQASAMVRLINGERAYRGKAALSVDPFLTAKARDGSVWCPNNSSLVVAGRAKDMAVSGYFSHSLRLCTKYTIIDAMATWGYTGGRGEIISYNAVGVHTVSYAYGCSPSIATCPGSTTTTNNTVARAMSGWMRSSVHYPIITGSYNRVGCGAWVSSSGVYYYACLFALGGNPIATRRPPATPKPKPVATPTPAEVAVSPTAEAPTQPPLWATPSGIVWYVDAQGSATPVASAKAGDGPAEADPAGEDPAAGSLDEGGPPGGGRTGERRVGERRAGDLSAGPSKDGPPELPPIAQVALAAAGALSTLLVVWMRVGLQRRYRRSRHAALGSGAPGGGAAGGD